MLSLLSQFSRVFCSTMHLDESKSKLVTLLYQAGIDLILMEELRRCSSRMFSFVMGTEGSVYQVFMVSRGIVK